MNSEITHTTIVFNGALVIGGDFEMDGHPIQHTEGCFYNALDRIKDLESENKVLKEIADHYGNKDNWSLAEADGTNFYMGENGYDFARQKLKEIV